MKTLLLTSAGMNVKDEIQKSSYKVRVLTDDQALLVKDKDVKFVGKGEEILFG